MSDDDKKQGVAPERPRTLAVSMGHGVLQPKSLTEAIEVAKFIAHSKVVPKHFEGDPGSVLIAIQMGAELGLSPMSALQNIAVINGRPSLWGDAMLALVQSHPDCQDVVEEYDEQTQTATCHVQRKNRSLTTRTFSKADADTAGLWKKQGPWTQYPKRMLQMRARGFALRDSFPDALRGVISREEADDYPVDAREPLTVESLPAPVTAKPPEGKAKIGGAPVAQISAPAKTAEQVIDAHADAEKVEEKRTKKGQAALPMEREAGKDG